MKHYTYIIILLLFAKSLSAQEYEKDKKFINEVVSHEGKMIVLDHLNNYTIQTIRDDFKSDTVQYDAKNAGTLILTKAEQKYIHKQLEEMERPYLKSNLFPHTLIITQYQLDEIFKKDIRSGWETFHKHYSRKGYYSFSKPIFLRNDSLCIFYHDNVCGPLCADGVLAIYKKSGHTWKL